MSGEVSVLLGTAATIGFVHTVLGPDHYLPFTALSRARSWSVLKTAIVTIICGIAHVVSSVVLGFIGIAFGIAVLKLETIEAFRGDLASWLLIAFGFTYFIWGIRRAVLNQPHEHLHLHGKSDLNIHTHRHSGDHVHLNETKKKSVTPWVLFTIFIFGPCEPLIPILMYPAARGSMQDVVIVTLVFGLSTVGTMLGIVLVSIYGLRRYNFEKFERYSHALAGFLIFFCGGTIKFLGL